VYGDIEMKGGKNYNKLLRMSGVSSKMSRNENEDLNAINELRE
jgi:hypothetical protein